MTSPADSGSSAPVSDGECAEPVDETPEQWLMRRFEAVWRQIVQRQQAGA